VVLGTGLMGSGMVRLVAERPGLELVGVWARRPERAGLDAGRAAGLGRDLGVAVEADLPALLGRMRPDVALQATCSRLAEALPEIEACVAAGASVVSIAEELAWPAATSPDLAAHLDRLAAGRGVRVLGTGVNPGFVLDCLIAVLSGACARVESITARRVNDLSAYGPTVLAAQGVGLAPEAFRRGVAAGRVVGHVGFPQSIAMLAAALGWEIERVEESREPILSRVRRETPFVTVEPGHAAGCLHRATGFRGGRVVIELVHPQQVRPELEGIPTGDSIEIEGEPPVRLSGSPEIPGGVATVALAVNAIPRLLDARPGLRSMLDLAPVTALSDLLRPAAPTLVARGTWVEIHRVLLPAGQRAPQVPDDTQRVPLEMRVKGFLVAEACIGDEVEIETAAGRHLRGTLCDASPAHRHGFGPPVPELVGVGAEARALLVC
jgi:4-hydroxy-tetrahydrodipicolinate reductase